MHLHARSKSLPQSLDPTAPELQILTAAWRKPHKGFVKGLSNLGSTLEERLPVTQKSLNRLKTRFPTFRKLVAVPR